MNFKKRVNGSWADIPHYIHNTATDTIATLPAVLYPTGTTATVGLKGNTVQNGTPTPENPIMPQGTGDKTANLWNEEGFSARVITSTHEHTDTNTYGTTLSTTIGKETIITQSEYPTGTVGYQNGFFFIDVDFSKYEIGDKVTLSFDYICNEVHSIEGQVSTTLYAGKNSNSIPVVLSSGKWSVSGRLTAVITIIADMNPYVEVRLCGNSITVKNIVLNTGSTALPYEPYGYKIPILSGGVTTPIYLSEPLRKIGDYADTIAADGTLTRNVGVYKMRGTESWILYGRNYFTNYFDSRAKTAYKCICTHLIGGGIWIGSGAYKTKVFSAAVSGVSSDLDTFKSYLADQYSAGTPVTVWYALSSPTTEQITMPTIPVTAGANTLSVDTALQPSEVTVNYKGWHPVADAHEAENDAWT